MLYRRDAWLYHQKSTEQGRNFLKNLNELTQHKADINSIRKKQKEMERR
ncbi:hypothetical protein [Clostridium massiliamazoniense]|nr:hypothetical protein [Clostridium massiliamazoniense]